MTRNIFTACGFAFFLSQKLFRATCLPVCKHSDKLLPFRMETKVVVLINMSIKLANIKCTTFCDKKKFLKWGNYSQHSSIVLLRCIWRSSSLVKLGHLFKSALLKYIRLMLIVIFSFCCLLLFTIEVLMGDLFSFPFQLCFCTQIALEVLCFLGSGNFSTVSSIWKELFLDNLFTFVFFFNFLVSFPPLKLSYDS